MRAAHLVGAVVTAVLLLPLGPAYAAWAAAGTGTATAAAAALPRPGVTATCVAVDAIDVTWTVPATSPLAGFALHRSTNDGLTWSTIHSRAATANTTSYTHTDQKLAEATYVYRVTGVVEGWSVVSAPSESRVVLAEIKTGKPDQRRPASCT